MKFFRALCVLIIFFSLNALAQKQANIWYFGQLAGLDFNYNPPKPLLDGALGSHEGSAAMADGNGRLLFYTNGITVWNKNHQVMEAGDELGGHHSARQSAVIVPKPAAAGIYYILTVDALERGFRNGLTYSVIDLTANGGLGRVIEKGVQLHAPGSEGLSVIGSCMDGEDREYWALSASKDELGKIFAYKIDQGGIHKNPVTSSLTVNQMINYIKFSPAGNKVIMIADELSASESATLIIAEFDFTDGKIFSPKYLKVDGTTHFNQAEFSPDGKYLYASSGNKILQVDLSLPDYPVKNVLEISMGVIGDFQLAPDGNLYINTGYGIDGSILSMIRNPNEEEFQKNYVEQAVALGGRKPGLGLPNFIRSYFYNGLIADAGADTIVCSSQRLAIGAQPQNGTTYHWSPGTHLSSSTVANPFFQFHNTGAEVQEFEYILTATNEHCIRKDTLKLQVYPAPPDKILGTKSVCPGVEGVAYSVQQKEFYSYQWQVEGGTITAGQGTNTILIDWGPTNPDAKVTLTSTSSKGCETAVLTLPVRINVELDTETPQGPEQVCLNEREQVVYSVTNTAGSVYTWDIAGGVITAGQGTHQVLVDWQGLGIHQLWLQERSITRDTICFGTSDQLEVLVYQDTTKIALDWVSLSLEDDTQAEAQGNLALGALASSGFTLYRRPWGSETWLEVGSAVKDHISYTDGPLESDLYSYEYLLSSQNPCNQSITSPPHRTMLLKGEPDPLTDKVYLEWNPYQGWPEGVEKYEVWRKLDEQEHYQLLAVTDAQNQQFMATNAADGFTHHYRIKAVERGSGYTSWSNEISLSFTHDLMIPNVFTPNGDEFNATFAIKKLEMYPDNELTIYNRWGQVVFKKQGYNNDWDGSGATPGVYFYSLTLDSRQKHYKGWVMIVTTNKDLH
ncbi:hypothetical protein D770_16500 [Flammeovirgaceae bacterium 311]|nr:hypothetical protein D770_16500 [Flammeovirgaceae bacterium 311]